MPKARTAKNCYYCEAEDRIKMTFMLCGLCHRHFCSAHGVPDLGAMHEVPGGERRNGIILTGC
jgi:hypothetical protein